MILKFLKQPAYVMNNISFQSDDIFGMYQYKGKKGYKKINK